MELPKWIAMPLWIKGRRELSKKFSQMTDEELEKLTLKEIKFNMIRVFLIILLVVICLSFGYLTGKTMYDVDDDNYEAFVLVSDEVCRLKYNETLSMGYWGSTDNLLIFCEENYFSLKGEDK